MTKGVLDAMGKFDDPKRSVTYKERSGTGKMTKSGKQYDPRLLNHSTVEVPTALAREFFSTFRLKKTTDLDVDSISFRLFNEECQMSIREWSLRMGLFSRIKDDDGIWNERMDGAPKYTPGFKVQSALELVTYPNMGTFKTNYSKAFNIEDHILRFAQTFISCNLMGIANSALTTVDLYFTWCMAKVVKVHLGYWLAQACHQMTGNHGRHMYTCHLLGAYLQRNFIMKIAKSAPEVHMCEPPETFSVEYFFNKGLLYMHGKEVFFYEVWTLVKSEQDGVEVVDSVDYEEMKKEMGEMRRELGGVREKINALRGSITDLVGKSSVQSDRMADAVKIMMRLADWLDTKFSQTQKKLPPGPIGVITQPG